MLFYFIFLGHALGMFHTQARADRNEHIIVNTYNIISGMEDQFAIQNNLTFLPVGLENLLNPVFVPVIIVLCEV